VVNVSKFTFRKFLTKTCKFKYFMNTYVILLIKTLVCEFIVETMRTVNLHSFDISKFTYMSSNIVNSKENNDNHFMCAGSACAVCRHINALKMVSWVVRTLGGSYYLLLVNIMTMIAGMLCCWKTQGERELCDLS